MSYEMTLALRPSHFSFPYGLVTHGAARGHFVEGLGEAATLLRLAEQLDEIVVGYDIKHEDRLHAHQSVVNLVGNLASQFARTAVQAEVQEVIRYGVQAGGGAALGALGLTSKLSPEAKFLASLLGFIGGYAFGELLPIRKPILRATWSPYIGWSWFEIPPAQPGWSPAT